MDGAISRSLEYMVRALDAVLQTQGKCRYRDRDQYPNSHHGWRGKPTEDLVWFSDDDLGLSPIQEKYLMLNREAVVQYRLLSRDKRTLLVHADASSVYGFVAIATLIPSMDKLTTQILGVNDFHFDRDHPTWREPRSYAWNISAGEFYALLLAVESASLHVTTGRRVVVCTDSLRTLHHRGWRSWMLYSQLKQLHAHFSALQSRLAANNIPVEFCWIPRDISVEHAATDRAASNAAYPANLIGTAPGEEERVDNFYKRELEDSRLPLALRTTANAIYQLRKRGRINRGMDPDKDQLVKPQIVEMQNEREQHLRSLLAELDRTPLAINLRTAEWIKAEYIFRQTGDNSAFHIFHKEFPRPESFRPPEYLAPPYPQPRVESVLTLPSVEISEPIIRRVITQSTRPDTAPPYSPPTVESILRLPSEESSEPRVRKVATKGPQSEKYRNLS